jgi:hypothetical protein
LWSTLYLSDERQRANPTHTTKKADNDKKSDADKKDADSAKAAS